MGNRPRLRISGPYRDPKESGADELVAKRIAALIIQESQKPEPDMSLVIALAAVNNAYVDGILDELVKDHLIEWIEKDEAVRWVRELLGNKPEAETE